MTETEAASFLRQPLYTVIGSQNSGDLYLNERNGRELIPFVCYGRYTEKICAPRKEPCAKEDEYE